MILYVNITLNSIIYYFLIVTFLFYNIIKFKMIILQIFEQDYI